MEEENKIKCQLWNKRERLAITGLTNGKNKNKQTKTKNGSKVKKSENTLKAEVTRNVFYEAS